MATSLKKFTAAQLAAALNLTLGRGRPSFELRENLEAEVQDAITDGIVSVKKGKLVKN